METLPISLPKTIPGCARDFRNQRDTKVSKRKEVLIMKKKLLSAVLSAAMLATVLTGCGGNDSSQTQAPAADTKTDDTKADDTKTDDTKTDDTAADNAQADADAGAASGSGKVYYLNFKPEQAGDWEELAAKYTAETGVEVVVQTAASGTYESTLKSEMAKSEAPTLFQVNGPVGLATWKDYCYDLSGSEIYGQLKSDDFALKEIGRASCRERV